jgi:hypothetical protein
MKPSKNWTNREWAEWAAHEKAWEAARKRTAEVDQLIERRRRNANIWLLVLVVPYAVMTTSMIGYGIWENHRVYGKYDSEKPVFVKSPNPGEPVLYVYSSEEPGEATISESTGDIVLTAPSASSIGVKCLEDRDDYTQLVASVRYSRKKNNVINSVEIVCHPLYVENVWGTPRTTRRSVGVLKGSFHFNMYYEKRVVAFTCLFIKDENVSIDTIHMQCG